MHSAGAYLAATTLLLLTLLFAPPARAQLIGVSTGLFEFQPTPCDSSSCETFDFVSGAGTAYQVIGVKWRDALVFRIDSSFVLPISVNRRDTLKIPICFRPGRRGKVTDSLAIIARTSTGLDTFRVRVTGRGIGPALDASPIVLNFPKTNPPAVATLRMWIRNVGETPYDLFPSALPVTPPFSVTTTLPVTIPPGDSVAIDIQFKPVERGIYALPIDLPAGCDRTLQIALNGSTDLIGTGAVLRASKVGFNPVNNEIIPCGETVCTDVTISNVGNATLVIDSLRWKDGSRGYKVVPQPELPISVPPNGEKKLTVCLDSRNRGTLRDTLVMINNNRNPIAFGMVIDISRSMDSNMFCTGGPVTRIEEAITQGKAFLANTILNIPSISLQDQIAISAYSTRSRNDLTPYVRHLYPLTDVTDPVRIAAQNSLNSLVTIGGTPTGFALRDMVDTLQKSRLDNRVIVLLTDGDATDDNGSTSAKTVAALAVSRGIRIFTIRIRQGASSVDYLQTLSQTTGGASFNAEDCEGLQQSFERITDIVSRGGAYLEPFAISVTAPQLAGSRDLRFDSTEVGRDTCTMLTLSNVGEGTATISSLADLHFTDDQGNPIPDFEVESSTTFPIQIQESEQADVTICFHPTRIRTRSAKLKIAYNSCGEDGYTPQLTGAGFAWAGLRVDDERIGLPGDLVTMPIYVDSLIAPYEVEKIDYRISWDATMLDLRSVTPGPVTSGAAGEIRIDSVTMANGRATARIVATGKIFAGDDVLGSLEFLVLRGDSLGSRVELTSGTFADGNPYARLTNVGIIALDSTCFRSGKPIRYLAPGAKVSAGELTPSLSRGGTVTLPIEASDAARVEVTFYDATGTVALQTAPRIVEAGKSDLPIAVETLATGEYFAVIRTNSGETILRKLKLVR